MKYKKISLSILYLVMLFLVIFTACTPSNTPTYGNIEIQSDPPGAKVYIDGVDTGKVTPYIGVNIETGVHTVRLELFQYQNKEDTNVIILTNGSTYLNWEMIKAPEQTITLQPGKDVEDAWVSSEYPSWNFNDDYLYIGTGPLLRSYIRFNLSSLPSNAVILDAEFGIHQYFYSTSALAMSLKIGLYRVKSPWAEDLLIWDNQPDSSIVEEDVISIPFNPGVNFVYWNISDLVQGWIDGNIINNGILLRVVNEISDEGWIGFWSSGYGEVGKRPKLELKYYIP